MKTVLSILLLCCVVAGCNRSAPGCSDKEVQELVIEIAKEETKRQLLNAWHPKEEVDKAVKALSYRLEAIRTREVDKETGSCSCVADIILTGEKGSKKIPIEYTSELTDKGDEFYVTVYGLE